MTPAQLGYLTRGWNKRNADPEVIDKNGRAPRGDARDLIQFASKAKRA